MLLPDNRLRSISAAAAGAFAALLLMSGVARAGSVTLKDGRVLTGRMAPVAGIADDPTGPPKDVQPIVLSDNGLTRTFIPKRLIAGIDEKDQGQVLEKFKIDQQIPGGGAPVDGVGAIINITPFDEFGRRIIKMNTLRGPLDVVQGITEITPLWTKVEGLRQYKWDMRIATSSIPRETLGKIIAKQIQLLPPKADKAEYRLKVVRLYLQGERYQDARKELEDILAEFPDKKEQFQTAMVRLQQLSAGRLLEEIKLRRAAGQHAMAFDLLRQFPSKDVAGDILQEVREMLGEYEKLRQQATDLLQRLDAQRAELNDETLRKRFAPMIDEIKSELNINTLERLASYQQLGGAAQLLPSEKLSLAISGWLLGKDGATENVGTALGLYDMRQLVKKFCNEPIKLNREQILRDLQSLEGASPATVAKLLANSKPLLTTEAPATPGFYELTAPGLPGEPPFEYLVQLPLEYDPYRRYPAVVTLNGAGSTPLLQIEWWAGAPNAAGVRQGQAARNGAIVIAPKWSKDHQREYGYTAVEHLAVLNSLRDACKRFAIDTDRVFLSGHSMGGDAAWDIALAHPDLWAGVIPIVAVSDKYCAHCYENAKLVPQYVVCGGLDGDKILKNARELDRYLTKLGYNITVVEYLGRGHEHFSDEILNIFDWMKRQRRNFFPREFTVKNMRPLDNFYWWLELSGMPPKSQVDPGSWPPPPNTRPVETDASIGANNSVRVTSGANAVSIWLSPELVDFGQPIKVQFNGGKIPAGKAAPSLEVLLDDVRTRGDRLHPFWARLESGRK